MNKLVAAAASDPAAEVEGVWREFSIDGVNIFRVKLRRAGPSNPQFAKLGEELMRKYRLSGTDVNDIDPLKQRELARELYAKTVVADWNADDFGVPYTADECAKTMEASTDFQDWVVNQSNRAAEYRKKAVEAAGGN